MFQRYNLFFQAKDVATSNAIIVGNDEKKI